MVTSAGSMDWHRQLGQAARAAASSGNKATSLSIAQAFMGVCMIFSILNRDFPASESSI
jgi:hypothetical protein